MKTTLSVILLAFFLFGCGKKDAEEKKESHEEKKGNIEITEEQFKTVGMKLGPVERKNLKDVVRASGYLKVPPQNQAGVTPYMGGVVKSINVNVGDYVRRGQALASLEHPDYLKLQEDYMTTKSNFGFLEKEYERQKELQKDNAGTVKTFQQTEANYFAEKARFQSLDKQLELLGLSGHGLSEGSFVKTLNINAPIDGYVATINAKIGTMAEVVKPLFEIIDNTKLHVDLFIYEKDLFRVKIGQDVDFTLTNQGNRQIRGKIFSISKAFENESKSVAIHAEIPGSDKMNLIQGMYVTALINVGENKVMCVPEETVVRSDGREFVFVLSEGEKSKANEKEETENRHASLHFDMKEVKVGVSDLGYIEIIPVEKLPDSVQVVTKEAFFLLSKTKAGESEEH